VVVMMMMIMMMTVKMVVMMMMMTTMTTLLRTTRIRNSPERSGEIFDVRDLGASCGYRCQDPYFKLLDLNGDGVITANEVYGYVPGTAFCKLIGMYVIGCYRLCLVMLFMVYAISRDMFMVYGYGYGFGVLVGFPLKKMGRCCWPMLLDALWLGLEINVFVGAGLRVVSILAIHRGIAEPPGV
jgi:hypothetical protein